MFGHEIRRRPGATCNSSEWLGSNAYRSRSFRDDTTYVFNVYHNLIAVKFKTLYLIQFLFECLWVWYTNLYLYSVVQNSTFAFVIFLIR